MKNIPKCGALMRDIYLVQSPIFLGMPRPPKCFTLCIKEYLAWLIRQFLTIFLIVKETEKYTCLPC
jgi:hypothetical protein